MSKDVRVVALCAVAGAVGAGLAAVVLSLLQKQRRSPEQEAETVAIAVRAPSG